MSNKKPLVEIRNKAVDSGWSTYDLVEILVDGEVIGNGSYGGEPEDNCKSRDYGWVEYVIEKLAKKLGAEVVITESQEEPEK